MNMYRNKLYIYIYTETISYSVRRAGAPDSEEGRALHQLVNEVIRHVYVNINAIMYRLYIT